MNRNEKIRIKELNQQRDAENRALREHLGPPEQTYFVNHAGPKVLDRRLHRQLKEQRREEKRKEKRAKRAEERRRHERAREIMQDIRDMHDFLEGKHYFRIATNEKRAAKEYLRRMGVPPQPKQHRRRLIPNTEVDEDEEINNPLPPQKHRRDGKIRVGGVVVGDLPNDAPPIYAPPQEKPRRRPRIYPDP